MWRKGGGRRGLRGCCGGSFEVCRMERSVCESGMGMECRDMFYVLCAAGAELRSLGVVVLISHVAERMDRHTN